MATGKVVVLMNCDNMYEALYDVLNQRYLLKKDFQTGEVRKKKYQEIFFQFLFSHPSFQK